MAETPAAIIKRFCKEDTSQNYWYWSQKYKEDPEGTLKTIGMLSKHHSMRVAFAFCVVGGVCICVFMAALLSFF